MIKILRYSELTKDNTLNESLPQQHSIDQLNMVRKISKGTDIGDRITDMNKEGANLDYIQNPIDTGVQSYQNYMDSNKEEKPKEIKVKKFKNK